MLGPAMETVHLDRDIDFSPNRLIGQRPPEQVEIAARYGTGKLPRGSPALDHHTGHDNRGDHDNRGGHIVHAASVSRRAPA